MCSKSVLNTRGHNCRRILRSQVQQHVECVALLGVVYAYSFVAWEGGSSSVRPHDGLLFAYVGLVDVGRHIRSSLYAKGTLRRRTKVQANTTLLLGTITQCALRSAKSVFPHSWQGRTVAPRPPALTF